jgi:hypothetical protein
MIASSRDQRWFNALALCLTAMNAAPQIIMA